MRLLRVPVILLWLVAAPMAVVAADFLMPVAHAQEAMEGFEPVAPGDLGQETLPATPLVFTAYGFAWLALIVYLFFLWRRIGRVEAELAELRSGRHTVGRS